MRVRGSKPHLCLAWPDTPDSPQDPLVICLDSAPFPWSSASLHPCLHPSRPPSSPPSLHPSRASLLRTGGCLSSPPSPQEAPPAGPCLPPAPPLDGALTLPCGSGSAGLGNPSRPLVRPPPSCSPAFATHPFPFPRLVPLCPALQLWSPRARPGCGHVPPVLPPPRGPAPFILFLVVILLNLFPSNAPVSVSL